MANVLLVVEGQSEERYVKAHFAPHYLAHGLYIDVTVMPNKRGISSRTHKGGRIVYDECVKNVRRFLRENSHRQLVALVYDYYGLDPSFTTDLALPIGRRVSARERAEAIRRRLESEINDPRFHFFVQLHEFEAYLFCAPEVVAQRYNDPRLVAHLTGILATFDHQPEAINDGPATAPSKRIEQAISPRTYNKTFDGVAIIGTIGIPTIRAQCPAFDAFCRRLDQLI